jgi:DNA (cytosine-5)-methyltransferase 1
MTATRKPKPRFTFVDLFAGIGGFHLALESLGGECVFASEIDDDCRKVYEKNFDLLPAGDIRPLTEGDAVLGIPDHDVLCAGFPCQPFSKSGFQRGINETRGTLFFNILRILEARRPRFAILENVRNLAGPRQRETWLTIIRHLRALGYRVADEPTVFSPHLLPPDQGGRPQVRERVFILCEFIGPDASGEDLKGEVLVENKPVDGWDPSAWRIEDYLDDDSAVVALGDYRLRPDEQRWVEAWNDFVQVIDDDQLPGFPFWVDEFKSEPDIWPGMPKWRREFHIKNSEFYVAHKGAIDEWMERHDVMSFPASRRKFEWQARTWQPTAQQRNLWDLVMHFRPSGLRVKPPTYLPALVAITQTSVVGSRRRRITPREAARLQGIPETYELHANDAVAYKQLGNGVNVGAVEHVALALMGHGLSLQAPAARS